MKFPLISFERIYPPVGSPVEQARDFISMLPGKKLTQATQMEIRCFNRLLWHARRSGAVSDYDWREIVWIMKRAAMMLARGKYRAGWPGCNVPPESINVMFGP